MTTAAPSGVDVTNAELLLWQGRFRRWFVLFFGTGAIVLKSAGVLSTDSVVARSIGAPGALRACIALIVAYLVLNEAQLAVVRRRGRARHGAFALPAFADTALLFGSMYLVTPPGEYARGLIVSVFVVVFTQLYFGSRASIYSLALVSLFYTAVVLAAFEGGALPSPAEQFWTLALFLCGMLVFITLAGQTSKRLVRMVQAFERAQEGDFSLQYDESLDRLPDAITIVGRAYNRMLTKLEAIVLTDSLTGCFNRRGFDRLTANEVSRAVRGTRPIAVLALDVDHFKSINDEFGHRTGDEVLREMGALLRETVRLGDFVGRIGGEEFEILAPETGADGARVLAERIQDAFHTRPFASVGAQRAITVSIGIAAEVPRNQQAAAALMARADEALYVAKRNGRDRTELWFPGLRAVDGSVPGRRTLEVRAVVGDH